MVDDDAAIRGMYVRVLRSLGEVLEARDGPSALAALEGAVFDAIILDWHLPGLDGHGVLGHIRKGPNRDTPVIVVTADPSDRALADALRDGAVFFFNKPVQLASLTVFVKTALAKKRAPRPG